MKDYIPKDIEQEVLENWIKSNIYTVKSPKKAFSMVIPPPNVTGSLHIGHALNITIQDIVARFKRMQGYDVIWVPGFDHAGIATQFVVERDLSKENKSRLEIGREEFLKRVWQWVYKSRDNIKNQVKRLGASVDWSRERFTMDEGFSRAVRHAFKKLYEEGLIKKDTYIINWCPKDLTALSDLEVEHEEEKGKLYYIKYPVLDSTEYIVVATTRPETMLGDVAVAVNPNDERYKHLIGKKLKLPLVDWQREDMTSNQVSPEIPVIADEFVDMEFGTGAVKITPAHDPNDYEAGLRQNLPIVKIMDEKARLTKNAGRFEGLDRYEARTKIVDELKSLGLLEKEQEHPHAVGKCYRCKSTIEPMVSTQWFLKVSDKKDEFLEVVKSQKTRFIPPNWEKNYNEWMENIKDWCISRQIWWGP
jgi:Valyl-tRNA synthetase